MDINDIELPDFIIAELYRDTLIAGAQLPEVPAARPAPPSTAPVPVSEPIPQSIATPGATTPAPAPADGGTYKFLGTNRKKISIVVESPGCAFLPDEQLAVLTKMLEACKMNMGDVALLNQATVPVKISALKQQLTPRIVLLFGLQPIGIGLPINFPQFKIQSYDQCTYLCAPSLEEMVPQTEASKLIKTKLWLCLKELFVI